jgi:hypothetical protein
MTDIDTITSAVVPDPLARLRRLLDTDPSRGGLGRHAKRWTLPARHDVGRLIREIVEEATAGGKRRYDAKVFPRLRGEFGLDQALAHKLVRFAETFSRERAVELSQTQLANGAEFSWSHVRRLLEVRDDHQREGLIEQTVRHGWTSERLAQEIQSARGGKKNKGGRRRHPEGSATAVPVEG